jgi:lysophospholipase L1-like esterase
MATRILFFLLCSSTLAPAQNARYDSIRYAREYYAERVAGFEREPLQKGRVIFLGDSQVEYGDWQKLLAVPTIVNRGVGGDNTFGVLDRLDDVIARSPSRLFLVVGINDISQNIPESVILKNIFTIIQRVKAGWPGTSIYVHSIFPTNDHVRQEYPAAFGKNAIVTSVNRQIQSAAKAHGFTYLDLATTLTDAQGNLDEQYAQPDGLHLNAKGYQAWTQFLKEKKLVP